MLKAGDTLVIAGPPDLIDEEDSFQRLMNRDPSIGIKLVEQDAALEGEQGGILQLVSAANGEKLAEYKLDSLPSWDGMATAGGRLFITMTDGSVTSYAAD